MILNKECYWNILDYTFRNLHFKEGEHIIPSDVITIETDEHGVYTPEYIALTRDFYLKF